MAACMPASARMVRAADRLAVLATAITLAGLLVPASGAQEQAPQIRSGATQEAAHWNLPRIFYDPRQRRSLDAQDRAIRLGLDAPGDGPSGPRFDGWLSGPSATHAWVSGTRYVADRAGRLHATGDAGAAGPGEIGSGAAQFDRTRGVLVVHRETNGAMQLRVGEADAPDPAAARPAGTDARP